MYKAKWLQLRLSFDPLPLCLFSLPLPFPNAVLHLSVSLPVFFLANILSKIAACICGGHLITLAFVTVSQNPPCCFSRKNIENIHIYLGEAPPSLLLAKCDTDAGALLHLRLIVWPNSSPLFPLSTCFIFVTNFHRLTNVFVQFSQSGAVCSENVFVYSLRTLAL